MKPKKKKDTEIEKKTYSQLTENKIAIPSYKQETGILLHN